MTRHVARATHDFIEFGSAAQLRRNGGMVDSAMNSFDWDAQ
jgi:hypothetical protein